MEEQTGIALAAVFLLGVGAQWIAWRIRLPAIILLLLAGLVAGPFTGFLNPDQIFGAGLLLQIVSYSVAIILFEGGLGLKFKEVRAVGGSVLSLVTVGMLVCWGLGSFAAYYILDFTLEMSMLIGGILVVTGPTVILPILRHLRPKKQIASLLKWEGIMIDPVGAVLAVLVFESLFLHHTGDPTGEVINAILRTLGVGFGLGLFVAGILVVFLWRFWVPEFLQAPFTLMAVIGTYAASNMFQPESGLLTVTVMGVALANQKFVKVTHILEFKENLQVLLISVLFILLAARIEMSALQKIGSQSILFLLALIIVVRPVSVFIATLFSKATWKERIFLAGMAPRGIVAAAIASVFALKLEENGVPDAALFTPNVFLVIVGTVLVYSLAANPLARRLQLNDANPQGVLFIGASPFALQLANVLMEKGLKVLVVDTNWNNVRSARAKGIPVVHGNVLNDRVMEELDLEGIGNAFAMTPNNDVNTLALVNLAPEFSGAHSFQLSPSGSQAAKSPSDVPSRLTHRILFGQEWTAQSLDDAIRNGSVVKATRISKEFDPEAFRAHHGDKATVLASISESKQLSVATSQLPLRPKAGSTLIFLLRNGTDESESEVSLLQE
ncbi:sodium:proton antiporter [Kamptonema cortianum]|nr:sodium:proton antiporter [Geitlerinema splendidum]MDK3158485.1 sodium:proton antiporter [Kamptonema cortianum]